MNVTVVPIVVGELETAHKKSVCLDNDALYYCTQIYQKFFKITIL